MGGPEVPALPVLLAPAPALVRPEVAQALFDRPRPCGLQVAATKHAEPVLVTFGEVLLGLQPEVLGTRDALVAGSCEGTMLLLAHGVDGTGQVLHQVVQSIGGTGRRRSSSPGLRGVGGSS